MASVDIVDVGKNFGPVEVLHDINMSVSDGEFIVLVGPSGCGKSTLLRMIAGLESISRGDIVVGGRVVNDVAPKDRDIAMVFQSYALYPNMTARDNMAFGLRMRGLGREHISEALKGAVSILGLQALLDRYPRQLSGGERQRVATGRAIVRKPQAFLFDEPLSNLDAKLRVLMRTEIKALHQRLGTTMIYVTHDQLEAMTMADRIVVMQAGRIEQTGPPLEIYDMPANVFVAGFIGSPAMNFIGGHLRRAEGGWEVVGDQSLVVLEDSIEFEEGLQVVLGIRPEHLHVSPPGVGLSARVEVVEPTGATTYVFTHIVGAPVTAVFYERRHLQTGEQIGVSLEQDRIHLFDAKTGVRIPVRPAS
jgi:multiple sugar transport system ATP-binding protein